MNELIRYERKFDMTEGVFDFIHIADKIQAYMKRNDRTGAFEYLSKTIGFQKYNSIFSHIQAIKKIEDKVPQTIVEYENQVIQEMNEKAFKIFGNDYSIVLDAL